MPWVRIDENAMGHPKVAGLSDGAFRLWVEGLAHCQKYLTDGFIAAVALRGLRAYAPKRREGLIAVGLWEDAEGGIQVHDYSQWNETRSYVLGQRELARQRMDRARGARWANLEPKTLTNNRIERTNAQSDCNNPIERTFDNHTTPHHTTPPVPTNQEQTNHAEATTVRRRTSDFDDGGFQAFWLVYPRKDAMKDAHKAWKQAKPPIDGAILQAILDDLSRRRNAGEWLERKFTPLPASYLRAERWKDEQVLTQPITKQTHQIAVATAEFLKP